MKSWSIGHFAGWNMSLSCINTILFEDSKLFKNKIVMHKKKGSITFCEGRGGETKN